MSTQTCRSCDSKRDESAMLLITCNLHEQGHRDCLAPMFICRPTLSGKPPQGKGHRPDCLSRSVMGADVHRIAGAGA